MIQIKGEEMQRGCGGEETKFSVASIINFSVEIYQILLFKDLLRDQREKDNHARKPIT